MTPTEILALPMPENDAKAATIRDYLKEIILMVWEEEESFSGKRPFGNSGWKYEIGRALLQGGAMSGDLDYDFIHAADEIVREAILAL